ncbi:hypothetical protein CHGG_03459 [Chaetomium globosum CBS 148.51]|uniref:Uncharacterized protein n=1 Tax=Chaetomium globosum (strain ATCC 6205 / CBS 148.51 / DSM 1962 / NBRC 6347 / NRRL 1970) TaxID=306901 RepID=Q2H8J5_CHAGB|nr:uncharacterized protein CHGG_03459 [Chaetomium globosum CBS 148.51]EAQ91524.1 hypothetical protein CHGG_03459 [Chaetomium globosum CBS 148.51]
MASTNGPLNGVHTSGDIKKSSEDEQLVIPPNFKATVIERIGISAFKLLNKVIPWYKLPGVLGAFNLAFLRIELRQYNLHDGYASAEAQGNATDNPLSDARYRGARNSDGKFNSLDQPLMGCKGMRFGRNFPRHLTQKPTEEELWTPNPRHGFSEKVHWPGARGKDESPLQRSTNASLPAWIPSFQIPWTGFQPMCSEEKFNVPAPEGGDSWPHPHMEVFRTKPDDILDPSDIKCPGYKNENTAWWDGSQIYGSSEAVTQALRAKLPNGKLTLDEIGAVSFLPRDKDGNPLTGFHDNCDQIFDKARLVNCALMAKIHTVEWTPAILAHPALEFGMNANWWGVVGEKLTKMLGRISKTSEIISGIPGSGAEQDGVPYSLTEEFVSVYRMHSLIPDDIAFHSATTGEHIRTIPVADMTFSKAQLPLRQPTPHRLTFPDAFYTFGTSHPGAITAHNYPSFLRALPTPDGQTRDLGTIDILRDRERGVPRYCAFRRLLRMSVPQTFEELTGGDVDSARELSEAYGGRIELVDALVGSHAEPVIEGFGFSETAFRVFIVMASRRLKSDRFIAGGEGGEWGEGTYTKVGFRWVQDGGMRDVLGRHFPELRETLERGKGKNVFAPWVKVGER